MIERTDFVSVPVQDLERGAKFYGKTLRIKRNEKAHGNFPEFETGNVTFCLIDPTKIGGDFSPNRNHIALRVPDVAEAREARGSRRRVPRRHPRHGRLLHGVLQRP